MTFKRTPENLERFAKTVMDSLRSMENLGKPLCLRPISDCSNCDDCIPKKEAEPFPWVRCGYCGKYFRELGPFEPYDCPFCSHSRYGD